MKRGKFGIAVIFSIILIMMTPAVSSAKGLWSQVGDTGILSMMSSMSLGVHNGTPYIAHENSVTGNFSVFRFDGSKWIMEGNGKISDGKSKDIKIQVSEDMPIAAFFDYNSALRLNASVYNRDDGIWEQIGDPDMPYEKASNISFELDNGVPYISYSSESRVNVLRFDGFDWDWFGYEIDLKAEVTGTQLAIDKGVPYVAVQKEADNSTVEIMVFKYSAGRWIQISNSDSSPIKTQANSKLGFSVHNGVPYIAYYSYFYDTNNANRLHWAGPQKEHDIKVLSYDGRNWVEMPGGENLKTSAQRTGISLKVYKGVPFLAYENEKGINVLIHTGNGWYTIGSEFKSMHDTFSFCLDNGVPYLAYYATDELKVVRYWGQKVTALLREKGVVEPENKTAAVQAQARKEINVEAVVNTEAAETAENTVAQASEAGSNPVLPDLSKSKVLEVRPVKVKKISSIIPGITERSIELTINNPVMMVNGYEKEIDPGMGTSPVIKDGRTFLPIRAVVEEMGGKISWYKTEQKVVIQEGKNIIELWIDKNVANINGKESFLDIAPFISDNGRTMLPIRFVGESLGYEVIWDENLQMAKIEG